MHTKVFRIAVIALLVASCSPTRMTPEEADRAEKKDSWLVLASGIFPPQTPRPSIIQILGKPDAERPTLLLYHRSKQNVGRMRSVRFVLDQSGNTERVEYLDAHGVVIPHSDLTRSLQ